MNIEQLKVFASGMINLANVILGVTLVTPVIAIVLYGGALDILSAV